MYAYERLMKNILYAYLREKNGILMCFLKNNMKKFESPI